ncbi:ABC transporter permease [Halorubrum trueperi]|uniref:ABC transporter permease n=1 Tax=Halorubrum trueperi TaxID=2004704 RepID=A0ABD5UQ91_9EURY
MSQRDQIIDIDKWFTDNQQVMLGRLYEQFRRGFGLLWADRMARVSLLVLGVFTFLSIFGPTLAPYDPSTSHIAANGQVKALQPPSLTHPFGTTHIGQDVFSHWMHGTRTSIFVGFVSGFVVMVIGTTVGIVSGYYKGKVDTILMRIVDTLYGVPALPLILMFALFFGASVYNIFIAMALVLWRTMSRIIRSQTLSLSERPYVRAAKATGASDRRIMVFHILPNILPLVFIQTVIMVSGAIILEAGVSFLGAGAQNTISWGTMLQQTFVTGAIRTAWWWVIIPGISISMTVVSLFYITRALEKITNPEVRTR